MTKPRGSRAQRKKGAALRETRRAAERNRRRNAAHKKRNKPTWAGRMARSIRAWPRGARRGLLAFSVVLALFGVWLVVAAETEHSHGDRALMATEPVREVRLVKEPPAFFPTKGGPVIKAEIDGRLVPLEHGDFEKRELSDGDMLKVVIDPTDPQHLVAVGEPPALDRDAERLFFVWLASGGLATVFAALSGWLLMKPELEPVLARTLPTKRV